MIRCCVKFNSGIKYIQYKYIGKTNAGMIAYYYLVLINIKLR